MKESDIDKIIEAVDKQIITTVNGKIDALRKEIMETMEEF